MADHSAATSEKHAPGWPARLAARLRHARGALSVLDQALVSSGNFATGLVLARAVGQEAFGVFVLATLLMWFAVDVQRGIALQPLAVLGAALDRSAFRRLLTASLPLQVMVILCTSLAVAAGALLWAPLRPYVLPLAAATAVVQIHEFCRRALYARGALAPAMLSNVLKYDLQAAILLALALVGGLTVERSLWVLALTGVLALIPAGWALRPFLARRMIDPRGTGRELLHLGGWGGLSLATAYIASGAFPAFVYQLVGGSSPGAGLVAAAGIGVIWQLLGPVHLVLRPLDAYYLPRAASALDDAGPGAMRRVLFRGTALTAPFFLLYLAALAVVPAFALERVYGPAFAQHANALRLFALVEALYLPTQLLIIVMQVQRRQRLLFAGELVAVAILYPAATLLVPSFGLLGAGAAVAGSALGRLGLLGAVVARTSAGGSGTPAAAPAEG